jgi:hypothetical protein
LSPLQAAQAGFVVTLIPLVALALYKGSEVVEGSGLLSFVAIYLVFPAGVAIKCKLEVDKHLKSIENHKD